MFTLDKAKNSVVKILREGAPSGTGFLITPSGHILTCWHVIEPLTKIQILFDGSEEVLLATLVKDLSSIDSDLAVLKIDSYSDSIKPLPFSLEWNIGDSVWIYGYQYQEHLVSGYPLTGKITGETRLSEDQQMIVISDTDIQRGLSGSPIIDLENNKVIGVVNAKFDDKGIGFAIPFSTVIDVWPEIEGLILEEKSVFISNVGSLFEVQGYKLEYAKMLLDSSNPVDIYGEITFGITKVRVAIKCIQATEKVDQVDLEDFAFRVCVPLFNQRKIEKVFVVTDAYYSEKAISFGNSLGIQLSTYSELERSLIDFTRFLQNLVHDYENYREYSKGQRHPIIEYLRWCDLNKYYIDLHCMDLSSGQKYDSLGIYIDNWLSDRNSPHFSIISSAAYLSVLGNYGTGKTSFCLQLTYKLAKRYLEDPISNRIPVYFSLRNFDGETDIRKSIMDNLSEYGIVINDYKAFEKMLASGKLLLIFDGFDEMVDKLDKRNVLLKFNKLSKLATGASKLLLTCRTHYFRTEPESIDFLAPENMTDLMIEVRSREDYKIVEIIEFDQNQIIELLDRYTGAGLKHWADLQAIYNLADLAKRPILLSMIVQTLPELLEVRSKVDSTSLYEVYTKYWLEREDWRSPISKDGKKLFTEELAWQMFISDKLGVAYEDLASTIRNHFSNNESGDTLHNLDTNIRTSSFLSRDKYGNYSFAHKSFMEFFVAKKIARDLENKRKDSLSLKPLPYEIINFLKDMLSPNDISTVKGFVMYSEYNEMLRGACLDILMFLGETIKEIPFVYSVSYSPDGNVIATGAADCRIRIWDSRNLNMLNILQGHSDWVRTVTFRSDGKYLASSGWDGVIKIWDVINGYKNLRSIINTDKIVSICFSPDGNALASGGFDKKVKIWDPLSGELKKELGEHRDVVWCIRYSPQNDYIVSGGMDKTVRIWSLISDELHVVLRGHTEAVGSVSFDLSSKYIISGGWVGEMIVWDIQKREIVYKLQAHNNKINMFSFSPDGKFFASCGDDRKIKVWVLETGELVHVLSDATDFVMAIQYSPDGSMLCGAGYDTKLRLWNTKTWDLIRQVSHPLVNQN